MGRRRRRSRSVRPDPTYDGTAKSVSVTTTPSGLSGISVTYNGSTTAPTAAGSYTVAATLHQPQLHGISGRGHADHRESGADD